MVGGHGSGCGASGGRRLARAEKRGARSRQRHLVAELSGIDIVVKLAKLIYMGIPSTTTLLSASKVAEDAGVPRSTLLYWVQTQRVVPAFQIDQEKQTPLFTKEQRQQIIKLAQDWRKGREARVE